MKLLFLLLIFSRAFCSDVTSMFIQDGQPTDALCQILELNGLYDSQDSFADMVSKTQKSFIQVHHGAKGQELGDLKDSPEFEKIRPQIVKIATKMGLFAKKWPKKPKYDYAFCFGAFVDGVRFRINELIEAWKSGVRFDQIVFMTGERKLRNKPGEKDDPQKLKEPVIGPYETEYDMVRIVWAETELPEDMKGIKAVFVNASCPPDQERISSKDCYKSWLRDYQPKPGSCLTASHPLYWAYQELAIENLQPPGFSLASIVKEGDQFLKQNECRIVSLIQDTIAKCLYEISINNNFNAIIIEEVSMVAPILPTNHGGHGLAKSSKIEKDVEKLTELLSGLDGLTQTANLPSGVQQLLDLRTQIATRLTTADLSTLEHVVPALHKTMAHLRPIVNQLKEELDNNTSIDFTKGPFASAWTNSLLDKAIAEMTSFLQLIS